MSLLYSPVTLGPYTFKNSACDVAHDAQPGAGQRS